MKHVTSYVLDLSWWEEHDGYMTTPRARHFQVTWPFATDVMSGDELAFAVLRNRDIPLPADILAELLAGMRDGASNAGLGITIEVVK